MLVRSNVTGMFDFLIGTELDPILNALENPEQANLDVIRRTASMFIYGVGDEVRQYTRILPTSDRAKAYYSYWRDEGFHHILAPSDSTESSEQEEANDFKMQPSANPITTLRPYADHAEAILGQLLALQNRVFPSLPTPVWAWS